MIDLTLHGAAAIAPIAERLREEPALLGEEQARALLVRLLKTAMAPLEREGDWAPTGMLLRALDTTSAMALQDVLLPALALGGDPAVLPDATVVVLAGLLDAAERPGKALALLDELETGRKTPRFMAMSWQARCHILKASPALDLLWPGVSPAAASPRAMARHHAQARRMEEALTQLTTALDQATTPAARRGIGGDLAVLAAWLHAHGQGALLDSHRPIARHLASQPAIAREALDLLLRAPASRAWDPMRESWLEAARRYIQRFVAAGHVPAARPDDFVMRCRPAA